MMKHPILITAVLSAFPISHGFTQGVTGAFDSARDIVAKHEAVFDSPPQIHPATALHQMGDAPVVDESRGGC